jgi:hypothetical protein
MLALGLLLSTLVPARSFAAPRNERNGDLGFGIGFGAKFSTLGAGFDVAVPISSRANIRGGFTALDYGRNFLNDGVTYKGTVTFRSVNAVLDFFPLGGGFHVSPGALLYNGNEVTANATVPGGQSFTLNNVNYRSSTTNPLVGTGKISLNKAAPMVMVGWGNLVPRTKHFSTSFEVGVVFQGAPQTTLNLAGSACDPSGVNCRNVATDPTIQSNIEAQQKKINDDVKFVQYYPVVSFGFGYRF